jgi:hypothetical protein
MAPTDYRDLGLSSLSRPFVPPLQISANNTATRTGRRVLLSGGRNHYKSLCTPICATILGPTRNPRNLPAGGYGTLTVGTPGRGLLRVHDVFQVSDGQP